MARGGATRGDDRRGGYQQPQSPAPVSGPGALSRRTDQGQPVRVASGLPYGGRKALEGQQAAAPLASGGPPSSPSPSLIPPGGAPFPDAFRPSERGSESPLAGLAAAGGQVSDDADLLLRILYRRRPVAEIGRLIRE